MDLYKLDTAKRLRVLQVYVNDDMLHQDSGIYEGKIIERSKRCTPKNVGRSNETTGHQQALFQADAVIKKKLREGYSKTIAEAQTREHISPMLAHSYGDHSTKIDWNTAYGNYKLDGIRSTFLNTSMVSRKSKPFETLDHILNPLIISGTDLKLDGEIYVSPEYTFQETTRLIKKYRPGETELLKYHIYDHINDEPYYDRIRRAEDEVGVLDEIVIVQPVKLNNYEELVEFNKGALLLGYEGSMLRWGNDGYSINKRSDRLLKFKQFIDIDAVIIDISPNVADPTMGTPEFTYTHTDGEFDGLTVVFKAGVKGGHKYRRDMLTTKTDFIGKLGSIRFFEWTDDGIPRFAIFHGIHIDR